jgi:hypothetical protein
MSIIAAPKDHHILIFATALLWSWSWDTWSHSTASYLISLRSILILCLIFRAS